MSRRQRAASLVLAALLCACAAPRTPLNIDTRAGTAELRRAHRDAAPWCRVPEPAVREQFAIPQVPEWFFKPFASQRRIAYGTARGNYLLDLDSGYAIPVPGARDPVPTPDERFLTAPGIELTLVADLLDEQRRASPRRLQAELTGEYQSAAVLRSRPEVIDYRFLSGRFEPAVRDFRVSRQGGEWHIRALNEARRPCRERQLHLPMMAKDGSAFGAYDVAAGRTRVFALGADDDCAILDDLGMPTGKLSFSFDNRYLAFHLALNDRATVTMAEVPPDTWTSNVFVYDRRQRKLARLTHNSLGNAYYPAFRRDGTLVYLWQPLRGAGARYTFVLADPAAIDAWLPLRWFTRRCQAGDAACLQSLAIGALWGLDCTGAGGFTARTAALNTLNLAPASCRDLVHDRWLSRREQVAAVLHGVPGAASLARLQPAALLARCADSAYR